MHIPAPNPNLFSSESIPTDICRSALTIPLYVVLLLHRGSFPAGALISQIGLAIVGEVAPCTIPYVWTSFSMKDSWVSEICPGI
jgi:hypothetical protein